MIACSFQCKPKTTKKGKSDYLFVCVLLNSIDVTLGEYIIINNVLEKLTSMTILLVICIF